MKSKIFFRKKTWSDSSVSFSKAVEQEINDWLAAHPAIRIVDIRQSSSGGSLEPAAIATSIWYEEAG